MAYTTIDDPSAYFQTVLWTGDDQTDRAITNTGNSDLQPDLVWIKSRNDTYDHVVVDSSRGASTSTTGKQLSTNLADTEPSNTNGHVKSFNSDGFNVRSGSSGGNPLVGVNKNNITYVAWQWKVNGGTATTSQSESGSNIACSVQANTTSGFSIITYTGTGGSGHTILHGLGSAPQVVIAKGRSVGNHWRVYHKANTSQPETDSLKFNDNDATADHSGWWDDTAPSSTEIALGNDDNTNEDGSTYVAYAWKAIKGFSKFGGYKGNGDNDGPLIYTGFKPAMLIIKCNVGHGESWHIWDNKRVLLGGNPNQAAVSPDTTGQDTQSSTPYNIDFLSNGFKIREDHDITNGDGDNYIYMAWAENPFVSSEGIPTTAA